MNKKFYPFLAIGFLFLSPAITTAATISLTPTYNYTVIDAVTGDNLIPGEGWYVDPGADEHQNDFIRERPLGTNGFGEVTYNDETYWVQEGAYYAYLDIVTAEWGYDDDYLYFKQTLYGNWDMNDKNSDPDYEVFGSGTLYNIIIGQGDDPDDANNSILLRATGDNDKIWGTIFESEGTQGWWDADGDVGQTGVSVTQEDGDSDGGNGYEFQAILTDGYFDNGNGNPYLLYARVTGAEETDDSQPYVEIALNYSIWNDYLASFDPNLPFIDPELIPFIVFETNRGIKDNQNYLWNDKNTFCEEGSPYYITGLAGCDPITQFGNLYELDRVYWTGGNGEPPEPGPEPIPEPATMLLLGTGLVGVAGAARRKKKNQA